MNSHIEPVFLRSSCVSSEPLNAFSSIARATFSNCSPVAPPETKGPRRHCSLEAGMKSWTRFTGWTGPMRDKHSHGGEEGDEGDKEWGGTQSVPAVGLAVCSYLSSTGQPLLLLLLLPHCLLNNPPWTSHRIKNESRETCTVLIWFIFCYRNIYLKHCSMVFSTFLCSSVSVFVPCSTVLFQHLVQNCVHWQ